jgi:predicted RNA-binding protein with TRAM domain
MGARRREWGPRGGERVSFTGSGFRTPSVPVEEGKVYDAQIEDIGREGDGVARIQNFVVFVPGTRVGDKVKVRITKIGRRMAFGEVVKE